MKKIIVKNKIRGKRLKTRYKILFVLIFHIVYAPEIREPQKKHDNAAIRYQQCPSV